MADRPRQVIRLLVYTYETEERMLGDMGHWSTPANGTWSVPGVKGGLTIRSATLSPQLVDGSPCADCGQPESDPLHDDPREGLDFDATPEEVKANSWSTFQHPFRPQEN